MAETKGISIKKVVYYDDDYTEQGKLPETEHFPEINFEFRPMNNIQTARMTDLIIERKTVEGATLASLEMLSRHLTKWDLKKPDDSVIDFTRVGELKKIDPSVTNDVVKTIRGDFKSPAEDLEAVKKELKNL